MLIDRFAQIQDSECYKNVRVHHTTADPGLQAFSYFQIDHKWEYDITRRPKCR